MDISTSKRWGGVFDEESKVYCPGRRVYKNGQCISNIKWYNNYAVSVKVKLIPLQKVSQPNETTVIRLLGILNTKLRNIFDNQLCLFYVQTIYVLALSNQVTGSSWFCLDVDLRFTVTLELELFSVETVSALHKLEIPDGDDHVYRVKVVDAFGNYDNNVFLFNTELMCRLWPDISCYPCDRVSYVFDLMDFLPCPRIKLFLNSTHWKRTYDGVFHIGNTFKIDTNEYVHFNNGAISLCYDTYQKYMTISSRVTWSTDQWVSLVCIVVSLVCLILSLMSYALLPTLRFNTPGKNAMALFIALLTAHVVYIVSSFGRLEGDSTPCKAVGLLSHFSWLMVIMWMNVCTIHMYRVFRKTQILPSETNLREYCLYNVYAFTVSATCVGINSAMSTHINNNIGYGYKVCHINLQENVIYTFMIPVCLVIVSNFAMFIQVVIRIRNSKIERNVQNDRNELLIFVKLSTITGMTWIFGIIYSFTEYIIFSYLFIVLNASQGVFLFFAFIVNKRVLGMILELLRADRRD
ncbi:adhesion G protein-coupled receptor E2-like isoform X2 [Dreissena polymorpha]|uniref:adhesion G protein-coupled receptor E2-like isoform X2 n=1 Tax=Dreissena polymorpha TaxID=45954 RepID=UPI002264FFC7|nr:adhesion G protein-coupled receptor E2-like isoform X2 [Dreissena polymorpha]